MICTRRIRLSSNYLMYFMLLKHIYSLKVIFHALELVGITVYVYCCYIIYVFGNKLAFHTENGFTGSSVCYIFVVPQTSTLHCKQTQHCTIFNNQTSTPTTPSSSRKLKKQSNTPTPRNVMMKTETQ